MNDLQETQHPSFPLPTNKDIPIWRYMDLAEYLAMLQDQSLFFARATLLGDPFEGASTNMMVSQREYVKKNRAHDPALAAYKDLPDEALDGFGNMARFMVPKYLINCWHMNESESAAM